MEATLANVARKHVDEMDPLTPGLNSINVLRTAFMLVGPKSARIQSSSQYLFTLLGSTGAKAVRRMLMKLTAGWPRYSR